jgi:hypothetical protein
VAHLWSTRSKSDSKGGHQKADHCIYNFTALPSTLLFPTSVFPGHQVPFV